MSALFQNHILRKAFPIVIGGAWLLAVGAGLGWMWNYAQTPGAVEEFSGAWPVASQLPPPVGQPALVVFAHPRCGCTRATLGELAQIMSACRGRVQAQVCFFRPSDSKPEWSQTDLWHAAAAIPGVRVVDDAGGREAESFHATISGQTFLFDSNGLCQFSGGITRARGHAGDNMGRSTVTALLWQKPAPAQPTPVFGCSLRGDAAPPMAASAPASATPSFPSATLPVFQ